MSPSSCWREPSGSASGRPELPTTTALRSPSKRSIRISSVPRSRPISSAIAGVNDLHNRPRRRLAVGAPTHRLESRIDALPVTVKAREDDHLRREREVPLDLARRASAPLRRDGERDRHSSESEPGSEYEP